MNGNDQADRWVDALALRLRESETELTRQFANGCTIRHCVLDGLLPEDDARAMHAHFPTPAQMHLRNTFRERKYVSAQMDRHDPLIEAGLFAFHADPVVEAIRDITAKCDLQPDPQLYAGGVSLMSRGHFLNPHIDNSHDGERAHWRNLNLLYYVTPDWPESAGGDLELWPDGFDAGPIVIPPRFNRLVIMETHQHAWHSVKSIAMERSRCCMSNYYFGDTPMRADQRFHVTSFRARPEQPLRDWASRADSALRMLIRKGFRKGVVRNRHRYER